MSSRGYVIIIACDQTNTRKSPCQIWTSCDQSWVLPRRQQLSLCALVPAQVLSRRPDDHGAHRVASVWEAFIWEELWRTFPHHRSCNKQSPAHHLQHNPRRLCRVFLCSQATQCFNSPRLLYKKHEACIGSNMHLHQTWQRPHGENLCTDASVFTQFTSSAGGSSKQDIEEI